MYTFALRLQSEILGLENQQTFVFSTFLAVLTSTEPYNTSTSMDSSRIISTSNGCSNATFTSTRSRLEPTVFYCKISSEDEAKMNFTITENFFSQTSNDRG